MTDDIIQRLRETGWRRKLTEAEAAELCAWFAAHPDARQEWETEERLSRALGGLKDTPVSSNFTARVLRALERDTASETSREPAWKLLRRSWGWLPKAALTALVVGAGLFAFFHQRAVARTEMVQSITALASVKTLPSPEVLADYDAIRRLGRTPPADRKLLALLK